VPNCQKCPGGKPDLGTCVWEECYAQCNCPSPCFAGCMYTW
jgi:hypothetical protein